MLGVISPESQNSRNDLTLAQLSILLTLLDQGPIGMTNWLHANGFAPTTTVAIRRLEKLALVKAISRPSDLRAVLSKSLPRD